MRVEDAARRTRRGLAGRRSACSRPGRRAIRRDAAASAVGAAASSLAARDERRVDPLLRRPVERRAGAIGEDQRDRRRRARRVEPRATSARRFEPAPDTPTAIRPLTRARQLASGTLRVPRPAELGRRDDLADRRATRAGRAPAIASAASTAAGATTTTIPRPPLNVARSSSSSMPPRAPEQPHDRRHRPARRDRDGRRGRRGSTRGTLPGRPPPVMWATPWRSLAARRQRVAQRQDRAARRSGSASAAPRRASASAARLRAASAASRRVAERPRSSSWYGRPVGCRAARRARARARSRSRAARSTAGPRITSPARAAVPSSRPSRSTIADAEPGEVEVVRAPSAPGARPSRRRPAHSRPAGSPRRRRRRAPRPAIGSSRPDRHVVEEQQRLGAGAHDVVGAHRDEVDGRWCRSGRRALAMAVFVPDAVGRRRRAPARDSPAGIANAPPKPPRPPSTSGRCVDVDRRAHQLDRALPGRDVDAGAARTPVAAQPRRDRPSSSSMNLRSPASYGTGSG